MMITKGEAKDKGLKFYFTGKPCNHGHIDKRYVSSGRCVACKASEQLRYQEANREAILIRAAKYRSKNKSKINERSRKWRAANPEKAIESSRKAKIKDDTERKFMAKYYRDKNKDSIASSSYKYRRANKDKLLAQQRKYRSENPNKANERRAIRMHAKPFWADEIGLKEIYSAAKILRLMDFNVHVDHIIPLVNKFVCGLHVPSNLRIIGAFKNQQKSNKFNIDGDI